MKDQETIAQFIALRAQGRSFAAIAAELGVSKPSLVAWGRQHQFEINNLKTIELEALAEQALASRPSRWQHLGQTLHRVEAELAGRDLTTIPTARLVTLASSLRAEVAREFDGLRFSQPVRDIPDTELVQTVHDWQI